jgi:hypothetical protein
MDIATAQRIVLRFDETFIGEWLDINIAFFESNGLETDDYYPHLCPPSSDQSNKMYIVLDMYTRRFPQVDCETMEYHVFKVKKKGNSLYVTNFR